MQRIIQSSLLILSVFAWIGAACAQEVLTHPDPTDPLADRWAWAESEMSDRCSDGCWVAYSIQRMMEPNSFSGWFFDDRDRFPTLQSLVYGREVEPRPDADGRHARGAAPQKVLREVALLFQFDRSDSAVREVHVSNISLPVNLHGQPLIWLGRADQSASIGFVDRLYQQGSDRNAREELVSAVGMHDQSDLVVPFLSKIIDSDAHEDVRSQAVFWLAEADHPGTLTLMERIARKDRSDEVRKQAVFGVNRIETDEAEDLLIKMARSHDLRETREEAIFWLGQKASAKAAGELEDIAENDPDIDIQKRAVFAISELPSEQALPRLISIARTHPHPKIRHEAIFWLGESGDPSAVDVLVDIVKGK